MKLTKQKLMEIIKEELNLVLEDRQEHIAGIQKKLPNLRKELEHIQQTIDDTGGPGRTDGFDEDEWAEMREWLAYRDQLEMRIDTLEKQLEELIDANPYPGVELPIGRQIGASRGEGPFKGPDELPWMNEIIK